MPINAVIPLLLLAVVPLGYGAGEAASWVSVPVLFAGFAGFETVLGADFGKTPIAHPMLAYRIPIWAYIIAQLAAIMWGIETASHLTAGRLVALAVSTGEAGRGFGQG